jgi:hypothetical protein
MADVLKRQLNNSRRRAAEREKQKEKQDRERQQREQRQRESEDRPGSRPVTVADVRRMTKPTKPTDPQRATVVTGAGGATQQRKKDRRQASVVTGAGLGRPSRRQEEDSEAKRFSYRPPEDEDDDDDDRERGLETRRPLPTVRRPSAVEPRRFMYDTGPGLQVGLDAPAVDTGPTSLGGGGPQSDTVASGWRPALGPLQGPRTREESQGGGMGPQLPGAGRGLGMMDFTGNMLNAGRQLAPALGRAGNWINAQFDDAAAGTVQGRQELQDTAAAERFGQATEENRENYNNADRGLGAAWRQFGQGAGAIHQGMTDLVAGITFPDYQKPVGESAGLVGGGLMTAAGAPFKAAKPLGYLGMQAANLAAGMQAGQDWMNTRRLPNDQTLGANLVAGASAFGAATDPNRQSQGNPLAYSANLFRNTFNQTLEQFRQATTPSAMQTATNTPEELRKMRERSELNWADPEAVAKTYDTLADRSTRVQGLYAQAKQSFDTGTQAEDPAIRAAAWAKASDLYAQAYELEKAHPIQLVNQNTNIGRQLLFELFQPDITDVFGGLMSVAKLSPAARRLAGVGRIANAPAARTAASLDNLALGPTARFASGTQARGAMDTLWQNIAGTVGASRADQAADTILRTGSTILADAETAADARILLTVLARNPAQLLKGIPANLFQSAGLLARAGDDGLIRFGASGMNTKKFVESLNSFRSIADEYLANSKILNGTGPLNRVALNSELVDAVQQGGYRYYGVAADAAAKYGDVIAKESKLKKFGEKSRQLVSPFFIYLSPGTWQTNILGAAASTGGDGTLLGRPIGALRDRMSKVYGVAANALTMRGLEGASGPATFAGQLANAGPLKKLKEAYGKLDEFFGDRVFLNSADRALAKYTPQAIADTFAPILQQAGLTGGRELAQFTGRLADAYQAGENPINVLNNLLAGRTKAFSISSTNPLWAEALPHELQQQFYRIIDGGQDAATIQPELQKIFDQAGSYYDNLLSEAPPAPQRWNWTQEGTAQDIADIDQMGRMAQKFGVSPESVVEWQKANAATMQDINRRLETLSSMVTESMDPNNRYLLYDIWGKMHDKDTAVRFRLGEAAEDAYARTAGLPPGSPEASAIWQENYFGPARQAWDQRNAEINQMLEQGATALSSGQRFTPDYSDWDILERTARLDTARAQDTLRLEPQSGRYDARLGQVIDAGRQLTDQAVAKTYAAARRFYTGNTFDYLISAEKNVQVAGAQVRSYLDKALDAAKKSGKWDDYFSIRNETWRQFREYEGQMWTLATRQIVEDGLQSEIKTGLKFDAGPDGVVEVLYPNAKRTELPIKQRDAKGRRRDTGQQYASDTTEWVVRREDGTVTTISDNALPPTIRQQYNRLDNAAIDAEVQTELDNLASAQPLAADAQQVANRPPAEGGMPGVWRTDKGDTPVRIIGSAPPGMEGDKLFRVQMADGYIAEIPPAELLSLEGNTLRRLDDIEAAKEAERTVGMAGFDGGTEARSAMRAEWDRVAQAGVGLPKLDTFVQRYYRNGVVRIPDKVKGVQDLYGAYQWPGRPGSLCAGVRQPAPGS